jgi:hypothetical protein
LTACERLSEGEFEHRYGRDRLRQSYRAFVDVQFAGSRRFRLMGAATGEDARGDEKR